MFQSSLRGVFKALRSLHLPLSLACERQLAFTTSLMTPVSLSGIQSSSCSGKQRQALRTGLIVGSGASTAARPCARAARKASSTLLRQLLGVAHVRRARAAEVAPGLPRHVAAPLLALHLRKLL